MKLKLVNEVRRFQNLHSFCPSPFFIPLMAAFSVTTEPCWDLEAGLAKWGGGGLDTRLEACEVVGDSARAGGRGKGWKLGRSIAWPRRDGDPGTKWGRGPVASADSQPDIHSESVLVPPAAGY